MVPQVSDVLRVVLMQRVAPLPELLALLQAQADESELLPARLSRVRQASRLAAPLQAQAPVPWLPLEQRTQALPARLALPLAQQELRAHSVSQQLAPRSLAEVPQAQQASSARPSQPRLSLPFPLWQPLPLALPLRRLPESFCAPSQRHPQGSSSSASFFP